MKEGFGAITGIKLDAGDDKAGMQGKKRARNKLSELEKCARERREQGWGARGHASLPRNTL